LTALPRSTVATAVIGRTKVTIGMRVRKVGAVFTSDRRQDYLPAQHIASYFVYFIQIDPR
jgi:hypothetical protein